jgi:hypothetical protein
VEALVEAACFVRKSCEQQDAVARELVLQSGLALKFGVKVEVEASLLCWMMEAEWNELPAEV